MTVSADASFDHNGLPPTYQWKVLRGDPAKVRITPINSTTVQIEIDYHPIGPRIGLVPPSNRVDIGLFLSRGMMRLASMMPPEIWCLKRQTETTFLIF